MAGNVITIIKETPFVIHVYSELPEEVEFYQDALNLIYEGENELEGEGPWVAYRPQELPAVCKLEKSNKKAGNGAHITDVILDEIDRFLDGGFDDDFNYKGGKNPFNVFFEDRGNESVYAFVPDSELKRFLRKNRKIMPPLVRESDKKPEDAKEGRAIGIASGDKEGSEFKEELISPDSRQIVDWGVRHAGTVTVYTPVYEKTRD